MGRERDTNLELLRIISIFLIVLHHLVYHTSAAKALSVNRFVAQYYMMGGKLGVNCFVLITGYYSYKGKFKVEKLWNIEKITLFYTILFLILFSIFMPSVVKFKAVLSSIFPVTFRAYWYVTAYVGMYVLSPFLNVLINNLNEKKHKLLLIIIFIMISIIPSFIRENWWFSEIGWFLFLYMVGSYIQRKREYFATKKSKYYMIMAFNFSVLIWLFSIGFMMADVYFHKFHKYINSFSVDLYSAPLFLCSVCFFLAFLFASVKRSEITNKIAKHTFGIYLIQSNPFVASFFLWKKIDLYKLNTRMAWPLIAIIIVIIIISVCFIIDCIREKFMSFIPANKRWSTFLNKVNQHFSFS